MVLLVIKRRYVLVIAEIEDGVNCDQLIIREVKYLGTGKGLKLRNPFRSKFIFSKCDCILFAEGNVAKCAEKYPNLCFFKSGWRQLV